MRKPVNSILYRYRNVVLSTLIHDVGVPKKKNYLLTNERINDWDHFFKRFEYGIVILKAIIASAAHL